MAEGGKTCSACAKALVERNDGIELWGAWFCSTCFISRSAGFHRELRPEEIDVLRRFGRELAGFLPPDLLEMILIGFHRRASASKEPPEAELVRCVGEIQRLVAFACFRHVHNFLKTWQQMFNEFVDDQETEMRDKIKKLTDLDA